MSEDKPRYDFHMHTFYSDGELIPIELIRRAFVHGNRAIAITDHVSFSNVDEIIPAIARDCEQVDGWDITSIPGAEITHVPPSKMDSAVSKARKAGAKIIVVHGESPVEPVTPGTNRKAVENPEVDILAHPGFITADEAEIAKDNGVFIEITCRQGHSLTNGHVRAIASSVGAKMLVNTDAHDCEDISTYSSARKVALGSGMSESEADDVLVKNARELLKRAGY
ncbi:MAG TPA: histidinol phosphate phosphatase domain-containing protein [Euryarchaeota archaeon]|nr:histidinol phosphate phosphatase domain-containing protein [Euryarchaeota archaeon]